MPGELSAADVAAVNRSNYGGYGDGFGFGGGSGIWLFAILALMWGGNGFFGNRNGERCATVEDINNSANFTRLESQVQANGQAIQSTASNIYNGICNLGYELAQQFGNTNTQIAECCCNVNRNIDAVRYEGALNTASINATTTAVGQKILDKLCQDQTQALRDRISQLELKEATCGMMKWPQAAYYSVGTPFGVGFNQGCGCNNNSNFGNI